jgi:hypothetical protein
LFTLVVEVVVQVTLLVELVLVVAEMVAVT